MTEELIINPLQEIIEMVKENPNDVALGRIIRNYILTYHLTENESN